MHKKYAQFFNSIACLYRDIQALERLGTDTYGLKGIHSQCLLVLNMHPEGLNATALCENCGKDKAAISRILAELTSLGLVQRKEQYGTRYRAAMVLTQRGQEIATAILRQATESVELACAGLTDSDLEVFYRVLGTITHNLHTIRANEMNGSK